MDSKKVIFLDRDGVINKKPAKGDYVKHWNEFEFLHGAIEGLKLLSENHYDIFIITNQAGIARGVMTINDLREIHKKLLATCKEEGITIKKIYYCPHGWDEECSCRKPKPGMLLQAALEHQFDVKDAIFIGDDTRDEMAGGAAGCRTILMQADGNLLNVLQAFLFRPGDKKPPN